LCGVQRYPEKTRPTLITTKPLFQWCELLRLPYESGVICSCEIAQTSRRAVLRYACTGETHSR
jgi:hypothetical protein